MTISLLAIVCVVLVGYPISAHIILRAAQPRRLRFARLGRQLLARSDVDDRSKAIIRSMLSDAYNFDFMAQMAVFLPLVVVLALRGRVKSLNLSPDVSPLFYEFVDCHILATSAANPLFALIVAVEMAFATLLLFPFGGLSKGRDVQVDATLWAERRLRTALA